MNGQARAWRIQPGYEIHPDFVQMERLHQWLQIAGATIGLRLEGNRSLFATSVGADVHVRQGCTKDTGSVPR